MKPDHACPLRQGTLAGEAGTTPERDCAVCQLEQELASIARQLALGLAVADLDGTLRFANTSWARMHGYENPDDLVGRNERSFHTEDQWRADVEPFHALALKAGSHAGEVHGLRKDGSTFPARMGVTLLSREDGTAYGRSIILHDITEEKSAEEVSARDQAIFEAALLQSPSGILIADAPDVNIRFANPAAFGIRGRSDVPLTEIEVAQHARNWATFRPDGVTPYPPEDLPLSRAVLKGETTEDEEVIIKNQAGESRWVSANAAPIRDRQDRIISGIVIFHDITERKRTEEALAKRIVALTQPLDDARELLFDELFDLVEIQRLQDEFADATGVASIITRTDGSPITEPSNFCVLCRDIIRGTEKGCANCFKSDAALGRFHPDGPIIQPCMSGGLWDAGAAISVGGQHIANWLIGQVRDDTQSEARMREYAREIGADEDEVAKAFNDVPAMSHEQFKKVSQALFTLANQLSTTAYQNVQQARFIAQRKRAEDDLLHLQNYLANIINSMPSMLVGVDRDGVITQWNSEAEQVTGLTPDAAVGQLLPAAVPRLADEMKGVREAMRTREVRTHSRRPYQEGAEPKYEDITIYPLVANRVEGAVIRIDDVTERVRIEEMMVQSEKMMSVGGLAAGMAHEINNPLAGVMQTADVLGGRLMEDLPANTRAAEDAGTSMAAIRAFMEARGVPRMLSRIRESGSRAAEIVTNMLSFARQSEAAFSSRDLVELLDQSVDLAGSDYDLKKKYDFRQIEIVRDYEPGLPLVPCEAAKIQQVLLNVLRNGAEAMQAHVDQSGRKPCFTLRVQRDAISQRPAELPLGSPAVRLDITDNGPGMPEETRRRVFEPFFTTKPVGVGIGLGLSVSYFIIRENHGGEMSVSSTPGEGTTFTIILPIERGAA